MRPGYIYFAETSAPYIKVGRCRVSLAKKEALYRRLDPGFIIRHAYECADVVVEENRVLNMLRLVAGTEVKGAGRECFALSVKDAVAVATSSTSNQEELARKLVLDHVVSGKSVRDLIAASDLSPEARAKDSLAVLERIPFPQNMRIKRAWCKRHDGIFESFKNPDMLK